MKVDIDVEDVSGLQGRLCALENRLSWLVAVIGRGQLGMIDALTEELQLAMMYLDEMSFHKAKVSVQKAATPGMLVVTVTPAVRPKEEHSALLARVKDAVERSFVLSMTPQFKVESVELAK